MTKSMTGFGRGSIEENGRAFVVEIKSVNHRYLDVNIKLPRNLVSLEDKIRKTIGEKIGRGKVDVFITQSIYNKQDAAANFNSAIGDEYFKCLQEIRDRYNVRDDISVSLIARFPEVVTLEQKEEDLEHIWTVLASPLKDALDLLVDMREIEGLKLKQDILTRCDNIKELVVKVATKAPLVVSEYKEKLYKRLKDLLNEVAVDENRLAMELAVFADKANIDEEIVRLNSHIVQMKDTLELNEAVGRKLDFIVQEMNREANTIGSKANDLELTNWVLNIKNEIEKIREQIQNLE